MKKYLLLIFAIISFHLLSAQPMYVNSSSGLNLREGPGTGYRVSANIPSGTRVDVIRREGDWARVKYNGREGYVSMQYLSENQPARRTSQSKQTGSARKSASSYSQRPAWGLGLRLGDPLGLTAKRYLSRGRAWEFNLGSGAYYRGYGYRDRFYDRSRYRDFEYRGINWRNALVLQAHYLFQKPIRGANNLDWYWGLGGQLRAKSYVYNYRFRRYYGPGQNDYNWVNGSDAVTDIDLGADIILGLEWHIPGVPLSVFGDINLMIELIDDPFFMALQGGAGIRFNF